MNLITKGFIGRAGFLITRGFGNIILKRLRHVLNFTVKIIKEVSFVFK